MAGIICRKTAKTYKKSIHFPFQDVSGDVGGVTCTPDRWTVKYIGIRFADRFSEGFLALPLSERHIRGDHPQVEVLDGADVPRVPGDHYEHRFFAFDPAASCVGIYKCYIIGTEGV